MGLTGAFALSLSSGRRRRRLRRGADRRRLGCGKDRAPSEPPARCARARAGGTRARGGRATSARGWRASCTTSWRTASARWWCRPRRARRCSSTIPTGRARRSSRSRARGARRSASCGGCSGCCAAPTASPRSGRSPASRSSRRSSSRCAPSGCPSSCAIEGEPRPLPAGVDLSAYRIVQEALTNTLKHARPAHVRVTVRYRQRRRRARGRRRRRADARTGRTAATGSPGCASGCGSTAARSRPDAATEGGFAVRARLPAGTA